MQKLALVVFLLCSSSLFAAAIDADGFIRQWLILGPYAQSGGNNPGTSVQAEDYLTDGALTQETIAPFEGMIVNTNYSIAQSTGLLSTSNSNVNPTGKPEWYAYTSTQSMVDFNTVFNSDIDDAMAYACCYVKNLTGAPLENVHFGIGSDDGNQVFIGSESVWNNSIARGVNNGQIQDRSAGFDLPEGTTRVLLKIFEGAGGWSFNFRFEDSANNPIGSDTLEVILEPYGPCPSEVMTFVNQWSREVTFSWEGRFSRFEVWEGLDVLVELEDPIVQELSIPVGSFGQHTYRFIAEIGDDEPVCEPVESLCELVPLWPEDFSCTETETGTVAFSWRNIEPYYEVLKIQEGAGDVLGIFYGVESAQLSGLSAGPHTFTLVAALAGYEDAANTCEATVSGPAPDFIRGDANVDGDVNLADVIFLLQWLFAGGDESACLDAADCNDDGAIDLSDPVTGLLFLFSAGAIPDPGAESCGQDPTPDTLFSCSYDSALCE